VAGEERLAELEHLPAVARERSRRLQQPAPDLAPDEVAGVVADDRRRSCHRDHGRDVEPVMAGGDRGGDERGLARHGQPAGLGRHDGEQQRVADAETPGFCS
jgi:hypothetical protein